MKIFTVDAFTEEPFSGNPAAVCVLTEPHGEPWMRDVAREMNLSETAYLLPANDGFHLRWFTPGTEVDLCGHATLASAHVLWETGALEEAEPARFHTRSGLLTASKRGSMIELDLPGLPDEPVSPPDGLEAALGARPQYVGRGKLDYLVELGSETEVRHLRPDFAALKRLASEGVIVTSRGQTPGFDFVSRYFAPAVGIDEDPVTGAAHCCLGPYWSRRLGKTEFTAFQASDRGGKVYVRVVGDRVHLAGHAVTVVEGNLLAG